MAPAFNYERSLRYARRKINLLAASVTTIVAQPQSDSTVCELKINQGELQSIYGEFKSDNRRAFHELDDDDDDALSSAEDELMSHLQELSLVYKTAATKATTYIHQYEAQTRELDTTVNLNQSTSSFGGIKQPKIEIPDFDGKTESFLEFAAIFESLVHHEPEIPKIKKLVLLKRACKLKAHDLIKDTPLTEAGYDGAWKTINLTYRNMKAIIRKHLDNLVSIPRIRNVTEVPELYATVNKALKGLEACKVDTETWSVIISYLVSERLDEVTYEEFEKTLVTNAEFPSWDSLRTFLESRCSITKRSADVPLPANTTPKTNIDKPKRSNQKRLASLLNVTPDDKNKTTGPICPVCTKVHLLINCDEFKSKSPKQRFESLKSKSTCRNCFKSNHRTGDCDKPPNCRKCNLAHHTLLHFDESSSTPPAKVELEPKSDKPTLSASCIVEVTSDASFLTVRKPVVLLPTAVIDFKIGDKTGKMRVLLDNCSQSNLITASFVKRHRLPTYLTQYTSRIAGVNETEQISNRGVGLSIQSTTEPFNVHTSFNIISTKLPYSVPEMNTDHLSDVLKQYKLADPAYYNSPVNIPEIDALLGIEMYDRVDKGEIVRFGSAVLRSTKFGYVLSSKIDTEPNIKSNSSSVADSTCCCLSVERVDARLKLFWETEEVASPKVGCSESDMCNAHFDSTYRRGDDGKFIVRLPFLREPSCVLNNYDQALIHQKRIQKRLTEPVNKMYADFMQEYIDLGHMTLVPGSDTQLRYFIPHHAVLKPSSTTTKLRCVFNASAKTRSGLSLNDVLLPGPTLQPELFDTLLKFRTYRYRLTGDITKMYRCIWIHPDDRRFQSILWQGRMYELNTVTYGTTPASFQATKCLQILSNQLETTEPIAAAIIRQCFYMDDLMMGADTAAEAVRLRNVVHETLASAGFVLRKYQSNSPTILNSIAPELIESNMFKNFGGVESLSVLGLSWAPETDILQLKAELPVSFDTITKRIMLSTIAKLFDPLGLAAPVVIRGKLMLQYTWRLGLGWDVPVPVAVANEFEEYVRDLIELKKFPSNCYVGSGVTARLVGFSDASEKAYCAVVYVVTNENNHHRSELFCAKTRVAPVKALTIPQLELQGAVLLSELVKRVREQLSVPDESIQLYCDSTIVLSWLARPPTDWKIFVRNRVAKITSSFGAEFWSHVKSNENPADLATRGVSTSVLCQSQLWRHGPDFLAERSTPRPILTFDERCYDQRSTPKRTILVTTEDTESLNLIAAYSTYRSLTRVIATAKVIAVNIRTRLRVPPVVQAKDILYAEMHLIRLVQASEFADERSRLLENRIVRKRSRLRTLSPFIDEHDVIRSNTRLQNSNAAYERKCPIILPANTHFTKLLIRHLHELYFHSTLPFLMAHLSTKFIFVGGIARTIKAVLRQCVTCRRYFSTSVPQQMAALPSDRVNPRPPFEVVGVDYTGAFNVKCDHHRTTKYGKSYAAIFVCFTTRAVHIEIVPSLSTEDFLDALRCFISRRGIPTTIYSDNGTNFRGAERYLNFKHDAVTKYAAEHRIEWRFNPPYTPHRGGLWESAVKSAKRFLPVITKDQNFTEQKLRVFFTQIEGILNSRPLTYCKTEDTSSEVLTPGHFLVGRNLTALPAPVNEGTVKLSALYRANQQRVRDFWKIWATDYLNQLRCRSKWIDVQPNITSGDIVLYREVGSVPCNWPLARVVRCFPDSKNVVRTIEILVRGQSKVLPINHVVQLPINTK